MAWKSVVNNPAAEICTNTRQSEYSYMENVQEISSNQMSDLFPQGNNVNHLFM